MAQKHAQREQKQKQAQILALAEFAIGPEHSSDEELKEYARLKALGLIEKQNFQQECDDGHREYARLKVLGLTEEQFSQLLQNRRVREFKGRLWRAQKKEYEQEQEPARLEQKQAQILAEREQIQAQILAHARARVPQIQTGRLVNLPPANKVHTLTPRARDALERIERISGLTQRIHHAKEEQERRHAQYAKELPARQEEGRRQIRQIQQARADRTGEDVNEIAREAE